MKLHIPELQASIRAEQLRRSMLRLDTSIRDFSAIVLRDDERGPFIRLTVVFGDGDEIEVDAVLPEHVAASLERTH